MITVPETYWIKASEDFTLAQSPNGLSHYTPMAHELAEDKWNTAIVDINHSAASGGKGIGKVLGAIYVPGDGLFQKIRIDDDGVIETINNNEHNGFSIGSRTVKSDGPSILKYEPHHVSVVIDKEPMCPKDDCDIVQSAEEDDMAISSTHNGQISESQLALPNDVELELLRFLIENKRFSTEVVFDAIAMVMERMQKDDGQRMADRLERVVNMSSFDTMDECMVRFTESGRTEEEARKACERIMEEDELADLESCLQTLSEQGKEPGEVIQVCSDIMGLESTGEKIENIELKSSNDGDSPMTDCECDNADLVSAEDFQALSSKVDELQSTLEEKEMQLSAKDEDLETLKEQNDNLSTEVEKYRQEKREELIEVLPETDGVDYESKSLERLQELHEFHVSTKKETAGGVPAGTEDDRNTSTDEPEKSDFKAALENLAGA